MNIPNTITMIRLFMTVLVFVCLQLVYENGATLVVPGVGEAPYGWAAPLALWLFILAAGTDFLDGYLARKWNMVTAFGRIADPFADKILITGTLIMLLLLPRATEVLTHWYVVIVVGREFLVTAIRGFVESAGHEFGADRLGKWKMVTQCYTVGALLMMLDPDTWGQDTPFIVWSAIVGFWLSLALTVVSGLNYCVKAHKLIKGGA